jgi:hypothetical protein
MSNPENDLDFILSGRSPGYDGVPNLAGRVPVPEGWRAQPFAEDRECQHPRDDRHCRGPAELFFAGNREGLMQLMSLYAQPVHRQASVEYLSKPRHSERHEARQTRDSPWSDRIEKAE